MVLMAATAAQRCSGQLRSPSSPAAHRSLSPAPDGVREQAQADHRQHLSAACAAATLCAHAGMVRGVGIEPRTGKATERTTTMNGRMAPPLHRTDASFSRERLAGHSSAGGVSSDTEMLTPPQFDVFPRLRSMRFQRRPLGH